MEKVSLFDLFHGQLTSNWYVNEYTLLMFFAPLVNVAIQNMRGRQLVVVLLPFYIMFFVWNWAGNKIAANVMPLPKEFGSYTCLMMIAVYLLARLIRRAEGRIYIPAWVCFLTFTLCVILCSIGASNYASPFAIGAAGCIFMAFKHWHWPSWVKSLARFLSPSMFSVFLLHSGIVLKDVVTEVYC
jgi:surface polysaccharide O-acyltransferase-like enzyme